VNCPPCPSWQIGLVWLADTRYTHHHHWKWAALGFQGQSSSFGLLWGSPNTCYLLLRIPSYLYPSQFLKRFD